MEEPEIWYIVKHPAGHCEIISNHQTAEESKPAFEEQWGPFTSQDEAFARRVGLIRAGKCKPV